MGKGRNEGELEKRVTMVSTGSAVLLPAPGDVGPPPPSSSGWRSVPLQMALTRSSEEARRS